MCVCVLNSHAVCTLCVCVRESIINISLLSASLEKKNNTNLVAQEKKQQKSSVEFENSLKLGTLAFAADA